MNVTVMERDQIDEQFEAKQDAFFVLLDSACYLGKWCPRQDLNLYDVTH